MNDKISVKRVRRPADYQLHVVLDHEEVTLINEALDSYKEKCEEDLLVELSTKFNDALATLGQRLKK